MLRRLLTQLADLPELDVWEASEPPLKHLEVTASTLKDLIEALTMALKPFKAGLKAV